MQLPCLLPFHAHSLPVNRKRADLISTWMNELSSCRQMPASWGLTFGCSTAPTGLTQCCQTCEPCAGHSIHCLHSMAQITAASSSVEALDVCRCHFTHGNSVVDAYKSLELARTAWTIATGGDIAAADTDMPFSKGVLKPGGSLVMKLLQGSGETHYVASSLSTRGCAVMLVSNPTVLPARHARHTGIRGRVAARLCKGGVAPPKGNPQREQGGVLVGPEAQVTCSRRVRCCACLLIGRCAVAFVNAEPERNAAAGRPCSKQGHHLVCNAISLHLTAVLLAAAAPPRPAAQRWGR